MAGSDRIGEIDFVRGIAFLLMAVFHTVVDLRDFYQYNMDYMHGFWFLIGKLSAVLFIITAGISCTLSSRSVRHGTTVFLWGMLLTIVTFFYNPAIYIRFGILHFLGVSIASFPLIKDLHPLILSALTGIAFFAGAAIAGITADTYWLLPFGIVTPSFASMDYYPLLPWYGFFLMGTVIGKIRYGSKMAVYSRFRNNPVMVLGRHSLLLYLVHQPVLLCLLYVVHHV